MTTTETPDCPSCGHRLASFDAERNTWWCGPELKEVKEWRQNQQLPIPPALPPLSESVLRVRNASTYYTVATLARNNGNTYLVTQAGVTSTGSGPTGTGSHIVDGTVVWAWQAEQIPSTPDKSEPTNTQPNITIGKPEPTWVEFAKELSRAGSTSQKPFQASRIIADDISLPSYSKALILGFDHFRDSDPQVLDFKVELPANGMAFFKALTPRDFEIGRMLFWRRDAGAFITSMRLARKEQLISPAEIPLHAFSSTGFNPEHPFDRLKAGDEVELHFSNTTSQPKTIHGTFVERGVNFDAAGSRQQRLDISTASPLKPGERRTFGAAAQRNFLPQSLHLANAHELQDLIIRDVRTGVDAPRERFWLPDYFADGVPVTRKLGLSTVPHATMLMIDVENTGEIEIPIVRASFLGIAY